LIYSFLFTSNFSFNFGEKILFVFIMVALAASESFEDRTNIDELANIITSSTKKIENITINFDTLLNQIYDKMIDKDKNFVYILSEKFKKEVERLPDYVDLYNILVEIDPQTTTLRTTKDSITLIEICEEHEIIFEEYLELQRILINLYR
jgi:hypothetical protein